MLVSNSLQVIMEAVKWLSSLTAVNPTKRLHWDCCAEFFAALKPVKKHCHIFSAGKMKGKN